MKRFPGYLVLFLLALSTSAQTIPTATLTGKVTNEGAGLPGVTVTVSSPNLQGQRTTITSENGDYIFPLLPAGEYSVAFDLAGMQNVKRRISLAATRNDKLDVELRPGTLAESITVSAASDLTAVLESTQVAANFRQELIEELPVGRSLTAVTLLSPGVSPGGPSGNITISGAMSFDSLYLVNGAIVNENLRGQPHDLFIEDAIQETTVQTGAISAEYGHFTGGVVNAITKSGGNELSGSLRDNLTNDSWAAETPLTVSRGDELNEIYEGTIGGPLFRDRLWFFGAGRYAETTTRRQTIVVPRTGDIGASPTPYDYGNEEIRLEGKLTAAITPRHNLVASYIDVDETEMNQTGQSIMDLDSLVKERQTPNTLSVFNYTGSLTDRFFVEAQYSEKEFAFLNSGSPFYDLIRGTIILDRARGTRYNAPTFKATPEGERRNHDLFSLKGTYFLSTQSFGSHEMKVGYEDFSEVRAVNNYQSGSDFRVSVEGSIIRGNQIFPRVRVTQSGTSPTRVIWTPIFVLSNGSDYATQSLFVNDRWQLGDHWTFNVGARYDKNDAVGGAGLRIADDDAISPRVAAHYDIRGNGRLVLNASYGQYVGRLAEGVGNDADPAGRNATFEWNYRGPSFNTDINAPTSSLVPAHEVLRQIFAWFESQGGTNLRPFRSVSLPGVAIRLDPSGLESPKVKEYTVGVGGALGARGFARADLVYRNWDDFYSDFNQPNSRIRDGFNNEYDLILISNNNIYDREYSAVQTQASYRAFNRLNLGMTYTWSELEGNVVGENSGSGPLSGEAGSYREYREERWNYPTGLLPGNTTHRARAWASYDLPTPVGDFNVSVLQNFDSGSATSYDGAIDTRPYVTNPGYLTPPTSVTYFFRGGRGTIETDDITRTDLALNWEFGFRGGARVFVQPEVLNVFNEQGIVSFNEEVLTALDAPYLKAFNPFTEEPIECPQGAPAATCQSMGAHWQRGENFGRPSSQGSYQLPRTFRVSLGLKF
jgi:hypothetical protein